MKSNQSENIRIRTAAHELCDALDRIRSLHVKLIAVLEEQESALVAAKTDNLRLIRDREEMLLRDLIEEEKERMLLTEELGDLLDHEKPVSIRVSEILPFLQGDLAARLSTTRTDLCNAALQLARQNTRNRALIEHTVGHIQIFMSRLAKEEKSSAIYSPPGKNSRGDGDAFLMDRTG